MRSRFSLTGARPMDLYACRFRTCQASFNQAIMVPAKSKGRALDVQEDTARINCANAMTHHWNKKVGRSAP